MVGQTIRAHAATGQPAVAESMRKNREQDERIKGRVQEIFDTVINPGVAMHGGVVHLLDVQDGLVFVQLGGGCQGCGMADVTLKQGIEVMLKERIPDVVAVVDQTDHAGGINPYYRPAKQ